MSRKKCFHGVVKMTSRVKVFGYTCNKKNKTIYFIEIMISVVKILGNLYNKDLYQVQL